MSKRPTNDYAHRLLRVMARHAENSSSAPHPVDQGEVLKIGEDDSDILISLNSSTVQLRGDEIQWMVDEDKLQVGDIVTVVYDKPGDPIVVSAVFQSDLDDDGSELASTISAALSSVGIHTHTTVTVVPTVSRATFTVVGGFDSVSVYVDGHRKAPTYHFTTHSPNVIFNSPIIASSIVQLDSLLGG